MVAKVRPCLVISIPTLVKDRALVTVVTHTTSTRGSRDEGNLWEIRSRISDGKRIARVMFTIEAGEMILLHGFVKKSQRTPRKDLRIARRRNKLWKRRTE